MQSHPTEREDQMDWYSRQLQTLDVPGSRSGCDNGSARRYAAALRREARRRGLTITVRIAATQAVVHARILSDSGATVSPSGYAASSAFINTANCSEGKHHACDGYVAPLLYSSTKPCECPCHDGIFGRDFARAQRRAERSYYRGSRHGEIRRLIGEALHANIIGASRNG